MTINGVDIKILESQDNNTLAKWWCELNRWNWPDEIPDPQRKFGLRDKDRRSELMSWISNKIGIRAALREWNHDMTDDEFNASPAGIDALHLL